VPGRVYAVGDVAAWRSPAFGDQPRLEHWSSAVDQARRVAHALTGSDGAAAGPPTLPYFWSDQYDLRLQLIGRPELATDVLLLCPQGRPEQLLGSYFRHGALVAAVTFGSPRDLARCRPLIAAGAGPDAVRTALEGFSDTR
jgi:NADPH-dependent 2,4-dienoyl-CoA reductase/sulfur reductase-like enzyme